MTPSGSKYHDSSLLTIDQAMRELAVSRATFYKLINSRQIKSVRIGRARRVSRAALAEFVAQAENRTL